MHNTIGRNGEHAVANYLAQDGFAILELNFSSREGEIDIIAQKNELIVFVEVKTRKTIQFPLSQVITPSKQRKIIITAKKYIAHHQYIDKSYRFDVALVTAGSAFSIDYIPNAFNEGS